MANHIVPKWASTWKQLGEHLNIEDYLLKNIEKDYSNDCEGSCSKMLQEWLDMNSNASWEVLIKALDKLAENARGAYVITVTVVLQNIYISSM